MKYRKGYKYQVDHPGYAFDLTGVFANPGLQFDYFWARLDKGGRLWIAANYAWDGPSGPTLDSGASIYASLAHDALYQAMREGLLSRILRQAVDEQFYEHLRDGGMSWFRAKVYYWAVRRFGAKATLASSSRPLLEAP